MTNVHTLNEINNGTSLVFGNKLEDSPSNWYPPNRIELESQLACANREREIANRDRKIAISCGNQLGSRYNLLIKNNERLSKRVCQLKDEARELKNQITYKDISLANANNEITTKMEEIQVLQSEIKELETNYSKAQKDLIKMDFLKQELSQEKVNVELKNIELQIKEGELCKKKEELMQMMSDLTTLRMELMDKKEELMQNSDDLATVRKEKEFLQETNTNLAEQISKVSSEFNEMIGGVSGLEKDNGITNPKTTPKLANSVFFQLAIFLIILLLIIYFLWFIFFHLYSFISPLNSKKIFPKYITHFNRNQNYEFPIHNAEEPKNRTTPYETLPYGYG